MKRRGKTSTRRSKRRAARKPDVDALFRDGRVIDEAIRRGVHEALREHKRRGESIVVWKDGRVVTIAAEDIPVGADVVARPGHDGSRKAADRA
jgi:hypothetical protein